MVQRQQKPIPPNLAVQLQLQLQECTSLVQPVLAMSSVHAQVVVGAPLEAPSLRLADSASDIMSSQDQGSRKLSRDSPQGAGIAAYLAALQQLTKADAAESGAPARVK